VGVLAEVQLASEDGVLSFTPCARVRRLPGATPGDGTAGGARKDALEVVEVVDEPIDPDAQIDARSLHHELWQQLGELCRLHGDGTERLLSAPSPLWEQRPGVGTPGAFSMALAALCELEPREQQRMLECTSTLVRLKELKAAIEEATGLSAARASLTKLFAGLQEAAVS
tara:strand:- start:188 stop:697 length:510 start_codon:yes stop_codon:yes gene_type:complete